MTTIPILKDDGTLDTVLSCRYCGETIRYTLEAPDEDDAGYRLSEAFALFNEDHECVKGERAARLLDWFIRNEELCPGANVQDLFINEPARGARVWEAAEEGAEGSTHAEIIRDWTRNAEANLRDWPNVRDAILTAAEDCEAWHEVNGSLDDSEWSDGDDDSHEDKMTDVEADADTLRSAGYGTDEDYGYYGGDDW